MKSFMFAILYCTPGYGGNFQLKQTDHLLAVYKHNTLEGVLELLSEDGWWQIVYVYDVHKEINSIWLQREIEND